MLKPDAGHFTAVTEGVECLVIELRDGLQIEQHDGDLGLLDHGENGGGEGVGGDEQEDDVDIFGFKKGGSLPCSFWRVDHAGVDDVGAHGADAFTDFAMVAKQLVE